MALWGVHMCKEHLRLNAKLGPPQSTDIAPEKRTS